MQGLKFNNQFTSELPSDPNDSPAERLISNALFARVAPKKPASPYLIHYSPEVAEEIGLKVSECAGKDFVDLFSGSKIMPGMDPHATCYGGHQFGNWAGQLGDGRAINLGEIDTEKGHLMLQLKGAGPTPFSRNADGFAVLRSSLREYLCSEAMHHLGIRTTRALSLIGTGEQVMRDVLYDGHPELERGAVVCRVSSSFVRFGHFQMLQARQEIDLLKRFTDFIIKREYPHLATKEKLDNENYLAFFSEVSERTAEMVVNWMRVGFVHGVMNTDNLSIIGETIDYGPYGFLDDFNPNWTPNTTDSAHRRYRYSNQPGIAQWNLMQLANALLPLVGDSKPFEEELSKFAQIYQSKWENMMARKLGLKKFKEGLTQSLLTQISAIEIDMTIFFQRLSLVSGAGGDPIAPLKDAFYNQVDARGNHGDELRKWVKCYLSEIRDQGIESGERIATMRETNPKFIFRNYLAQLAIDDANQGDFNFLDNLLRVLRNPYAEQPENENLAGKRPEWAKERAGCSMLSCSS